MDNDFFLNLALPSQNLTSSSSSNWNSLSSSMDLDHSFFNSNWEKPTEQSINFDSALSSLVSSPISNHSDERIMLGRVRNFHSGEIGISPGTVSCINNANNNSSSYSTPITSPKMSKSMSSQEFARFSSFGSNSFNGRHRQFVDPDLPNRSTVTPPRASNGNLTRVSSNASFKEIGFMENCESESKGKVSADSSSRKRKSISKGKAKEAGISQKVEEGKDDSKLKRSKQIEEDGTTNSSVKSEEPGNSKPPEPFKDYIHVRARRGQATDSHSLAERVRREKIGERMKFLQDLVPGCNKVTGKALMLDEIINYVQSLQRQVEFLSMKLASVNTRLDFNMDTLMSKDNSVQQKIFQLNSSGGGSFSGNQTQQSAAMHSSSINLQLHSLNQITDTLSQFSAFCGDDLQTLVQMGFAQNPNLQAGSNPHSFGSLLNIPNETEF